MCGGAFSRLQNCCRIACTLQPQFSPSPIPPPSVSLPTSLSLSASYPADVHKHDSLSNFHQSLFFCRSLFPLLISAAFAFVLFFFFCSQSRFRDFSGHETVLWLPALHPRESPNCKLNILTLLQTFFRLWPKEQRTKFRMLIKWANTTKVI